MLSGIAYLQKCNIIHTDVKPENILLKSPLPTPPPPMKTMYDLVQEQISNNPEVLEINSQIENEATSSEDKKRLRTKLKRVKMKIRKNLAGGKLPSLWGFFSFNLIEHQTTGETIEKEKIVNMENDVSEQVVEPAVMEKEMVTSPSNLPVNVAELVASLKPCQWEYPDDCFYMKLFFLCKPSKLDEGLGPYHGDRRRMFEVVMIVNDDGQ